jgi:hypothetical protein
LYNTPEDLSEEEKNILESYIESRRKRELLWAWLKEPMVKLKVLQMNRVRK